MPKEAHILGSELSFEKRPSHAVIVYQKRPIYIQWRHTCNEYHQLSSELSFEKRCSACIRKETYLDCKRDLCECQKRPIYWVASCLLRNVFLMEYLCTKRDLYTYQKRPKWNEYHQLSSAMSLEKRLSHEVNAYEKRAIYIPKETNVNAQRGLHIE